MLAGRSSRKHQRLRSIRVTRLPVSTTSVLTIQQQHSPKSLQEHLQQFQKESKSLRNITLLKSNRQNAFLRRHLPFPGLVGLGMKCSQTLTAAPILTNALRLSRPNTQRRTLQPVKPLRPPPPPATRLPVAVLLDRRRLLQLLWEPCSGEWALSQTCKEGKMVCACAHCPDVYSLLYIVTPAQKASILFYFFW